jgi:hypothetical protein
MMMSFTQVDAHSRLLPSLLYIPIKGGEEVAEIEAFRWATP